MRPTLKAPALQVSPTRLFRRRQSRPDVAPSRPRPKVPEIAESVTGSGTNPVVDGRSGRFLPAPPHAYSGTQTSRTKYLTLFTGREKATSNRSQFNVHLVS